eukprot:6484211-Amphidinium_carterae.1
MLRRARVGVQQHRALPSLHRRGAGPRPKPGNGSSQSNRTLPCWHLRDENHQRSPKIQQRQPTALPKIKNTHQHTKHRARQETPMKKLPMVSSSTFPGRRMRHRIDNLLQRNGRQIMLMPSRTKRLLQQSRVPPKLPPRPFHHTKRRASHLRHTLRQDIILYLHSPSLEPPVQVTSARSFRRLHPFMPSASSTRFVRRPLALKPVLYSAMQSETPPKVGLLNSRPKPLHMPKNPAQLDNSKGSSAPVKILLRRATLT